MLRLLGLRLGRRLGAVGLDHHQPGAFQQRLGIDPRLLDAWRRRCRRCFDGKCFFAARLFPPQGFPALIFPQLRFRARFFLPQKCRRLSLCLRFCRGVA